MSVRLVPSLPAITIWPLRTPAAAVLPATGIRAASVDQRDPDGADGSNRSTVSIAPPLPLSVFPPSAYKYVPSLTSANPARAVGIQSAGGSVVQEFEIAGSSSSTAPVGLPPGMCPPIT